MELNVQPPVIPAWWLAEKMEFHGIPSPLLPLPLPLSHLGPESEGEGGLYPHDSWMGNEGSSSSIFLGVRLAWLGIGALGERTGVDISSLKTTWKTKRKLKEEHRTKMSKRLALSQSLEFIILRRARGRLGERTWDWKNAMRDRQANTGELDTCLCAHMWPVE